MTPKRTAHGTERGSITMIGVGILGVIVIVTSLVAATFAMGLDIMKTRNTVDLAALSAAQVIANGDGSAQACGAARKIAAALTVTCTVRGSAVEVVGIKDSKFLWITDSITARAVAGPAREHSR